MNVRVCSNRFIIACRFENFSNKYIEKQKLDPAHFLSAPGLAWQVCLKKTRVKLELLTNKMLMMLEMGIRELEVEYVI